MNKQTEMESACKTVLRKQHSTFIAHRKHIYNLSHNVIAFFLSIWSDFHIHSKVCYDGQKGMRIFLWSLFGIDTGCLSLSLSRPIDRSIATRHKSLLEDRNRAVMIQRSCTILVLLYFTFSSPARMSMIIITYTISVYH